MNETDGGNAGKPRRRKAGKTAERPRDGKVKATIRLSPEASKRLSVHAAMMEMDRSALVERLINDHLRRYVVSDRGGEEAPPIIGVVSAA